MKKGFFESGVSAKILDYYAENPFRFLDEEAKKQMKAINAVLLRKFTELAFDAPAEPHWQENRPPEADEIDLGRVMDTDLQSELLETSDDPL